jgi:hypothetical protein
MAGAADVLGGDVQVVLLGQLQGGFDIHVGDRADERGLVAREHLATAEQLDLIVAGQGAMGFDFEHEHLEGLVGVLAAEAVAANAAIGQHEMAHGADAPLRMPQGHGDA